MEDIFSRKYKNTVNAVAKCYDITVLIFKSLPHLPRTCKYFLAEGLMHPALLCFSSVTLAAKTFNVYEKIVYLELCVQRVEYLWCVRDIAWSIKAIWKRRYLDVENRLNSLSSNIRNRQNSCIQRAKAEKIDCENIEKVKKLCESKSKAFLLAQLGNTVWTYPKIEQLKSIYDDITRDYLNILYFRNNGEFLQPYNESNDTNQPTQQEPTSYWFNDCLYGSKEA